MESQYTPNTRLRTLCVSGSATTTSETLWGCAEGQDALSIAIVGTEVDWDKSQALPGTAMRRISGSW
jgi:hypothetical protein